MARKNIITITLVHENGDTGLVVAIETPKMCNEELNGRMKQVHKKIEAIATEMSEIIAEDMSQHISEQMPDFLVQMAEAIRVRQCK